MPLAVPVPPINNWLVRSLSVIKEQDMTTLEIAASTPVKLENARQIVINEGSYISRRVGDWVASLAPAMHSGFVVSFHYKGDELANHVFGQLESAVNFLNNRVKEVVNNRLEDESRRQA
jgi:hypothetical protein